MLPYPLVYYFCKMKFSKQNAYLFVLILLAETFAPAFTIIKEGWKEFKPRNGGCSVLMPGIPMVKNKKANDKSKDVKQFIFYLNPPAGTDDNLVYGLSYTFFPPGTIHQDSLGQVKFFNHLREEMLTGLKAKLLSGRGITYLSYPGREYKVEIKEGAAVIRFQNFLMQDKYYTLQVCTPIEKDNNIAITKFFDSFKTIPD